MNIQNNVISGFTPDDSAFYANALQFVVHSTDLIRRACTENIFSLYFSPANPIQKQFKATKETAVGEFRVAKNAAGIARALFRSLEEGNLRGANADYRCLVAEIREINRRQLSGYESLLGTDLIHDPYSQSRAQNQCVSTRELQQIASLYAEIKEGRTNIEIEASESHPSFRDDVLQCLRMILSRPMGFSIVEELVKNKQVTIKILLGDSTEFILVSQMGTTKSFFIPFDPHQNREHIPIEQEGKAFSAMRMSFSSLLHEFIHALHEAKGERDMEILPLDLIYTDGEEEVTITGVTRGKKDDVNENSARAEFDLLPRYGHKAKPIGAHLRDAFLYACRWGILKDVELLLKSDRISLDDKWLGNYGALQNRRIEVCNLLSPLLKQLSLASSSSFSRTECIPLPRRQRPLLMTTEPSPIPQEVILITSGPSFPCAELNPPPQQRRRSLQETKEPPKKTEQKK